MDYTGTENDNDSWTGIFIPLTVRTVIHSAVAAILAIREITVTDWTADHTRQLLTTHDTFFIGFNHGPCLDVVLRPDDREYIVNEIMPAMRKELKDAPVMKLSHGGSS